VSELVWLAAANLITVAAMGLLFAWHVRSERAATHALVQEGYTHLVAKGARDVAEARALEAYEAEALRQHKAAFQDSRKVRPAATEPASVARAVDARGNTYEIISGGE
jgi:hypothetical protein